MQMRQDASGNSETELQQLIKTICVTKYDRYTDWDGGGVERVSAIFIIGTDPDHSIRFSIEQGPHDSKCYVVPFNGPAFYLRNATPDQYQSMITRWGLTTTRVNELEGFLEEIVEFVRQ